MTSLTGLAETSQVVAGPSAREAGPAAGAARAQVVGIDFGTSSSAVARLCADGVPRILPNGQGEVLTDSTLSFCGDGEVHVGEVDLEQAARRPQVRAVKRHLGDRHFTFQHGGRRLSPEALSALVLRRVSEDARRYGALGSAILTVPSYFYAPSRQAAWSTAQLAALPVAELLAEPVAAALSRLWENPHWLAGSEEEKAILVLDLGGGTFDVTVVRARGGRIAVAATEGDNRLGGVDWTERLVDFAAEKFRRRHAVDPRAEAASCALLFAKCEAAKCRLTRQSRAVIDVSCQGVGMPLGLSQEEFEQMTHDLLARIQDAVEFLFETSATDPEVLDEVLLVGGGSNLPCIGKMMTELCGRPVTALRDPQRSVVNGAAIYAAALAARGGVTIGDSALQQRLQAIELGDVNAHSVGIALDHPGGRRFSVNHILIPRNMVLPKSVKARFVTNLENPDGIILRVVEGEAPETAACTTISHWRVSDLPPNLPSGSPIELTLRCDSQREVTVEAREPNTSAPVRTERITSGGAAHAENQQAVAGFRLV